MFNDNAQTPSGAAAQHNVICIKFQQKTEPPLHLISRFIVSAQPGHIKAIHYQLKCHPPFPIRLPPLVFGWKITLEKLC